MHVKVEVCLKGFQSKEIPIFISMLLFTREAMYFSAVTEAFTFNKGFKHLQHL